MIFLFLSFYSGAMSDPGGFGFSVYMVLVGVFALLVAGSCSVCALLLSRLHRRHRTKAQLRTSAPEDNAINNQRQFCTLIRNLDHSVALLPPAQSVPTVPMPVLCSEEIELTLPPSPAPSPALKPAHGPKLDICNREREKLNRFHYAENQELEVWPHFDCWEGTGLLGSEGLLWLMYLNQPLLVNLDLWALRYRDLRGLKLGREFWHSHGLKKLYWQTGSKVFTHLPMVGKLRIFNSHKYYLMVMKLYLFS